MCNRNNMDRRIYCTYEMRDVRTGDMRYVHRLNAEQYKTCIKQIRLLASFNVNCKQSSLLYTIYILKQC